MTLAKKASLGLALAAGLSLAAGITPAQALSLGTFTFNDAEFGNTLVQSDDGTYAANNYLNTVHADPGSPTYLTGNNFETGIANFGTGHGSTGNAVYTIGYSTPIVNGTGADLGVVDGYDSPSFDLAVSTDGVNFSAPETFLVASRMDTGVMESYVYGSNGKSTTNLFVTPVDLSAFGIANGSGVTAIRVSSSTNVDLIRVAGFGAPVPEASTTVSFGLLLALGLGGVVVAARKKKMA